MFYYLLTFYWTINTNVSSIKHKDVFICVWNKTVPTTDTKWPKTIWDVTEKIL